MANVNQPVNSMEQPKKVASAMEQRLSKAFENNHANLMNEGEEEKTKAVNVDAMKRRLGLVK